MHYLDSDDDDDTDNEIDGDTTTNDDSHDTTTDSSIIDENVFEYIPKHQSCFAHTLQLAGKDGMKDIGSLQKVVTKASNIVSYIKKSYYVSEFLENFKSVSI